MRNLTLEQWGRIAQIVATFVALIGIFISMGMSIKALREVRFDRKLRQKPFLAFIPGGLQMQVEFESGRTIPGINPDDVEKSFPNIPTNAQTIRLKVIKKDDGSSSSMHYGHLKNYGVGPALSTEVTWIPKDIWIGSEKFSIDEQKLSQPVYCKSFNCVPTSPRHILPSEESKLPRLPTFIVLDFEKKISRVDGILEIEYEDIFEQKHKTFQEFHLFTGYVNERPYVRVTFSDILKNN